MIALDDSRNFLVIVSLPEGITGGSNHYVLPISLIVAVIDPDENILGTRPSMKHVEVVIERQVVDSSRRGRPFYQPMKVQVVSCGPNLLKSDRDGTEGLSAARTPWWTIHDLLFSDTATTWHHGRACWASMMDGVETNTPLPARGRKEGRHAPETSWCKSAT